jgi:hypothetical protein
MLNPSAEREVNNNYRLSTEKARQWWNNQAFESRKNIVIESDAVINDDQEVEDQMVADVADKEYDDLPDITQQEIDSKIDDEEDIEEIFDIEGEEYLQCSKCDDLFTSNEDYDLHKDVDHGEEPEDFEESEETYQLTMNPDLTREALREANSLLTETEERELYSGYDKNGDIQSSVMPYNVPAKATGKYNDNPNEFFYSNKIFRAGDSALRTSSLGEAKASEEFDISKYYKEIVEDGWMDYQCNSCGKKFDPDDGYGDQKDYGVLTQELKDHQINHKFVYESKASESYTPDTQLFWDEQGGNGIMSQEEWGEKFYELDLKYVGLAKDNGYDFDENGQLITESKASESDLVDGIMRVENGEMGQDELIDFVLEHRDTLMQLQGSWQRIVQSVVDDLDYNLSLSDESKSSLKAMKDSGAGDMVGDIPDGMDINEWLGEADKVEYEQVEYEDDGVSDISVPNVEPKGEDKNEFLDDVDNTVEEVNFVYPTKATESTKSYITESEPFEEEYEEFEDSDDEMIEETISIRKLTGYSDNSIAQELHINYGVSHEEALEKVYSVEVSTNDRVAQTFFGKMYKECTESEKDELRMYSGSD